MDVRATQLDLVELSPPKPLKPPRPAGRKYRTERRTVRFPRPRISTVVAVILSVSMIWTLTVGVGRQNELTQAIQRLTERNRIRLAILDQLNDRASQIRVTYEKRKRNLTDDIAEAEASRVSLDAAVAMAKEHTERIKAEIEVVKQNVLAMAEETRRIGGEIGAKQGQTAAVEREITETLNFRELIRERLLKHEQDLQLALENIYLCVEKNESLVTLSLSVEQEYDSISVTDLLLAAIPFGVAHYEVDLEKRLQDLENRLVDLRHQDVQR